MLADFCLSWIFFQMPLENFRRLYEHVKGTWKVHLSYLFTPVKKSRTHDTPITLHARKSKNFDILKKNEGENLVGIFWQPPIFWVETYFQLLLENFLLTLRTCSRDLKGTSNLVVYASNKIITVQHTKQNILANNKIMTWAETKKLIEISNPRKLSASRKWCPQSN